MSWVNDLASGLGVPVTGLLGWLRQQVYAIGAVRNPTDTVGDCKVAD